MNAKTPQQYDGQTVERVDDQHAIPAPSDPANYPQLYIATTEACGFYQTVERSPRQRDGKRQTDLWLEPNSRQPEPFG
ncbi:hypothetical protein RvVAR0630_pl04190 (plasmid) [Agrobacterium vitis]|nr:hypothetical protein RvVAR0630_pl04190 [Agrobacterium vitis]